MVLVQEEKLKPVEVKIVSSSELRGPGPRNVESRPFSLQSVAGPVAEVVSLGVGMQLF